MITTCVPPYEEWVALLAFNHSMARVFHARVGERVVREVRAEVVRAAREYSSQLREIARTVGISLSDDRTGGAGSESPIVMTGHQPVIYHPGLLEKTLRAQALSRETGALLINISIDTDEGDGGRLVWPLAQGDDLILKQGSVATDATLFREQRVRSAAEVSALFGHAERDLKSSGLDEVTQKVSRVSRLYQALANQNLVVANAIVRMAEVGVGALEIPLSTLARLSPIQGFIRELVRDGRRFARTYNATLDEYRAAHKIKNAANPFPNMVVEGEVVELPLWRVSGDSRAPFRTRAGQVAELPEGEFLAPRGSVVTLLLRGLCSDLFVHGLGGGRYDQFVDSFANAYWGANLPRFVVTSATRHLFPERVERYTRARELRTQYKEMVSHTEKFLGRGIFSVDEEGILRERAERRGLLLVELREADTPDKRSRAAHALNEVNRSIRAFIDGSSVAEVLKEGDVDDARFARWAYREFPFFFFQRSPQTP